MKLEVDRERLTSDLDALGAISQEPAPIVTRVVFTEADVEARNFVKNLCREAGLVVREDAVGNTFARWVSENAELEPVATGSHIDAISHAGRFDGTVGVLGGLEAVRALTRAGYRPRRSIELVIFTAEEPTRFGIGCLGSRLLSGMLDPAESDPLQDRDGVTLRDARWAAGFEGPLSSVLLPPGYYSAFVEMHIEQGPLLELHSVPVGVVTAIAAPASLKNPRRRPGWTRGRRVNAGSARCFSRCGRDGSGRRDQRSIQWFARYRGNRRRMRSFSGRCKQHPQPGADGNRCARH